MISEIFRWGSRSDLLQISVIKLELLATELQRSGSKVSLSPASDDIPFGHSHLELLWTNLRDVSVVEQTDLFSVLEDEVSVAHVTPNIKFHTTSNLTDSYKVLCLDQLHTKTGRA